MKRNPYNAHTNPGADGLKTLSALPAAGFNNVRQGSPLPTRMKILPWGDTRTVDGDTMRVNAQTVALLPDTQRAMNWPHAHVDIEHASVPGTPLFKIAAQNGTFAAILGWGTPIAIEGQGLFVDGMTWTPQSKRAYEFPDISGVVKHLPDGTVTGLHSFAFCCHGKAEGVTAFSALVDPQTEEPMDKLLMALLGCTEDMDDAAKLDRATKLGAALQSLAAGPDGAKAMSALLKLDPAKLAALSQLDPDKLAALSQLNATDLEAKITALSQMDEGSGAALSALGKRISVIEVDFKTLSQDSIGLRRSKILSDAAAKGKAVPEAWLTKYGENLAVLSDMIDGLPEGVVPLSQSAAPDAGRRVTPSSADEAAVAKAFGHNPKDLPKV